MTAPKLRFKEFDGDWVSSPLKKFFPKIRNGFVGIATPYYVANGVKYLQGKNVKDGSIDPTGLIYISEEFHTKKSNSKLAIDDILMVQSGHVGECAVIDKEYDNANCHALIVLSPHKEQETNSHFVKYYFYTPIGKKIISQIKTGNTIEHVLASEVKEIYLNFPSKAEQTKIATFLSAVDEKISQLSQKHQLLSQYKQGMMQKLFSQQIRFKADDGSEFAEWEYYKLGELTTLITKGTTPTSLGGKFENSGINFIKIESLSSDGKFLLDKFAYIDEVTHNKLARSQLENEDILFSIAGALGRVAIISNDYLPANTNQALAIIRLRNKNVTQYIYYFLNSDYVKKIIETESVQLAQANFSLGQLSDLDIVLPCHEEQTKIANFLSAIDQKIDVASEQLEQAKLWKKGLLQQMFV